MADETLQDRFDKRYVKRDEVQAIEDRIGIAVSAMVSKEIAEIVRVGFARVHQDNATVITGVDGLTASMAKMDEDIHDIQERLKRIEDIVGHGQKGNGQSSSQ